MRTSVLLAALALATYSAAAPLEPADGKILFGAWYARPHGDTPAAINSRVGKKLAMFQSDFNITDTINEGNPTQFVQQLDDAKTDAIMYMTVYPMYGFDNVTDSGINQLAELVGNVTHSGRKVFLRYASEMNGNWFAYGRQPTKFIASFRKVVQAVRAKAKQDYVAFVWAPNSSNGYPFKNDDVSGDYAKNYPAPLINSANPDFDILDTNHDKQINIDDDPYSPYWPGDEYVDWVGMSQYHYGSVYNNTFSGWVDNVLPLKGQIESMIRGRNGFGKFDFYGTFCEGGKEGVTKGGKPFQITETGATFHIRLTNLTSHQALPTFQDPGPGRVAIKQAWWEQFFNETFIAEFPRFKAVNFFEFQKFEEASLRDFTNLGPNPDTLDPFTGKVLTNETTAVLNAFLGDLPHFSQHVIFGNDSDININKQDNATNGTGGSNGTGSNGAQSGTSDAAWVRSGFGALMGTLVAAAFGLMISM
ncbi:hypothetical protein HDV00_005059 [Rhizophlyctis rosea]|nr:hypothetical protein HDV00_005059 [Rhizophlyctis rosea]